MKQHSPVHANTRRATRLLVSLMLMLLPLTATAAPIDIYTTADWGNFVKSYDGSEATLNLYCDLTIDKPGILIEKFKGTFNGNGHAITFIYIDEESSALFEDFEGTIQDLMLNGQISFRYGFGSYTESVPLIRDLESTVTIRNCVSSISFTEFSSSGVTWNRSHIGGFIAQMTSKKAKATFENCAFTGRFSYEKNGMSWYDTGGFVGYQSSGAKIILNNCISCINVKAGWSVPSFDYFVGNPEEDDITATNLYCYSNNTLRNQLGATKVTLDQLKSGEVTYLLNYKKSGAGTWLQTIGTDELPQLATFSSGSKAVIHENQSTRPATTDKWTTLFYPGNVTLPDGTKSYIVTDLKDGEAVITEFNTSNTSSVPLLLYNESGFSSITLPETYYNKYEQDNFLRGVYQTTGKADGDYVLDAASEKFVPATGNHAQWQCHIPGGTGDGYALNASNAGIYVIDSKESWNTFKKSYSGTEVKAYLDCDLTLTYDDEPMADFRGTFDGQGHSIIYDCEYKDVKGQSGAAFSIFYSARGTIRNLRLTGNVAHSDSYFPAPLVNNVSGTETDLVTLNVENCLCDVTYDASHANGVAFIRYIKYAKVNFTDCSFTGKYKGALGQSGVFIYYVEKLGETKATFTNCLCDLTHGGDDFSVNEPGIEGGVADYFADSYYGTFHTCTNCFASVPEEYSDRMRNEGKATIVTADQLASGEITYQLNNGRTGDDAPWAQRLSVHTNPQLKLFLTESDGMMYAKHTIAKDENAHWTTLYYPADVTFTADQGITVYDQFDTDDQGNLLIYENLSGTVKAGTPAILYAENGFTEDITLPKVFYNEDDLTKGSGCLIGTSSGIAASTLNVLTGTTGDSPAFSAGAENDTVSAWHCYTTAAYNKLIPDGAIIYSKDDWNTFKTKYNGKKQGFARLACDLTLTDDDEPMENFVGTFDGQGHTITVNYTADNEQKPHAPFKYAKGSSIRNLKLNGTMTISNYARFYASPLIYKVEGTKEAPDTLTIENCHSSVRIVAADNHSIIWAGGFANFVMPYATVNFTDCSFTGSFETTQQTQNSGGFIGYYSGEGNTTVSFTNCFSAPTVTGKYDSGNPLGYFCGGNMRGVTYDVKNCYARKSDIVRNSGNKITLLDSATIASGAAAYKLNAGRNVNNAPWRQTIGTDTIPQLNIFSADSRKVYEASNTITIGAAGWATHYYPTALVLSEGVKAYTVSGIGNEDLEYVVQLKEMEGTVPAYTPVLLCTLAEGQTEAGESKTISLPIYYYNSLEEHEYDPTATLMLLGVAERTAAPDGSYILQRHGTTTAFYRVDTSVAQPSIPAWRCLLYWKSAEGESSNAKQVKLRFDDKTTGIDSANAVSNILRDGAVYDLQGRKVQTLQKDHIYIKNGQKFVVK